ncbi:PREDICTED: protein PAM68, chloroplastic [Tarenaya hassleriana]|uniref:protein PAM68, chloroplastic n=1 Tax=Tarenaya hassleriana TaxID=28532 RepID=UPI00053C69F9|nr:PREDICTED: protein PAM68, chloroplastic [Tarenaya hassleriana]
MSGEMAAIACPYKLPHPTSSKVEGNYCKQSDQVEKPPNSHQLFHGKAGTEICRPVSVTTRVHISRAGPLFAALNRPRGFGPPTRKTKRGKQPKPGDESDDDEDEEEEEDREGGVIPEIVTNRMISRMGFTVGIPLFIGLLFFPFFYYLKVGLKIDVPTWVPFIVSFIFFGAALLGVSYGIVSSSWDPLREGSFLGWKEAQKNWPVFWQSLRPGGSSINKNRP